MDYSLTPRMFIVSVFLFFLCFTSLEGGETITPGGKDFELEKGRTRNEGFYEFQVDNEEEYVDIRILVKTDGRNALKDPARLWIDGIVPYKISDSFGSREKRTTFSAMRDFMMKTCIRFVPMKNDTTAFIFIEPGLECRATVGKLLSGKMSLGRSCHNKGIIMHELMHVLGFYHEHNRPDRDEYVKINWENIKEDAYHNFWKLPEDLVETANVSYDYDSIMHYRSNSFSKDRSIPTIITLKKNVKIGQRKRLSEGDILKIVKLYNCTMDVEKTKENNPKTRKIAAFMGDAYRFWKSVYMKNHNRFKRTADSQAQTDRYYEKADDLEPPVNIDKKVDGSSPDSYENRLLQWRNQYLYWWNHYHGWANEHSQVEGRAGQISFPVTEVSPTTKKKISCGKCITPKLPQKTTIPATIKATTASPIIEAKPSKITIPATTPKITTEPPKKITTIRPTLITERLEVTTSISTSTPCKPEITTKPPEKITTVPATPITAEQNAKTPIPTSGKPQMTKPSNKITTVPAPVITEELQATTQTSPRNKPEMTTETPKKITTVPATKKIDTPCNVPENTPCSKTLITSTTRQDPGVTTDQVEFIAECPKRGKNTPCVPATKEEEKPKVTTEKMTPGECITKCQNQGKEATVLPTTEPSAVSGRSLKETYELACEPDLHTSPSHRILIYQPIEPRTALKDPSRRWDDGKIPYELSEKYTKEQKRAILKGMAEFKNKTCIKFFERDDEVIYIHIEPESRCSSVIGKSVKNVSKVLISDGCYEEATILHELMHVLGFIHEQNRPDRDEHVRVVWDNIEEGAERNFQKFSPDVVTTLGSEYDYESLMHYDAFAFAKNSDRPTLVPLKSGAKLGNTKGFSKGDLDKINKLYPCVPKAEMSDDHLAEGSVLENFKKYLDVNFRRLFRVILRTIQKFKAIRIRH